MPHPHFSLFRREQCEAVHDASLEILRRTGVRVDHPAALALLRKSDAVITRRQPGALPARARRVGVDRPAVAHRAVQAGQQRGRDPAGGREVSFGTGSACPNYLDPTTGQRRPFTEADVVACVKLVDALPEIDFCMSMGMSSDLNPRAPYVDEFALMLEHTSQAILLHARQPAGERGDRGDGARRSQAGSTNCGSTPTWSATGSPPRR